jgi:transposase
MLGCVLIAWKWIPIRKEIIFMSNNFKHDLFISVGIDVGADFSFMSIALPNQTFVGKPFKIIHSDFNSLSMSVSKIKEAEEMYSLESRIFLESTGIYHFPLFCYLRDKGFLVSIINPIITKNSTNINIRKVHNDKFDSKKAALIGLKPDLKVSIIPSDLALDLRNLSREYYDLVDNRSAYINKLQGELRMVFPQYLNIFSKITVNTSLTLLEKFICPDGFLKASKNDIITTIRSTARFGISYAEKKYNAIIKAANEAKTFGYSVNSNFKRILLYIRFIRQYNEEIEAILTDMNDIVESNEDTAFVKQIRLIESFKGAGFLSAVSLMCEIGDFSAFKSPKQLFAYFGLDPAVKQSGKFNGTDVKMSKRGSRIARRVIHTMALVSIALNRNGSANNPVLRNYYLKKCQSKPKMVALGAIMHKVCNIVFAILRDEKEFKIITPEEHQINYLKARCDIAA